MAAREQMAFEVFVGDERLLAVLVGAWESALARTALFWTINKSY
jgi:hypothetical protein